MLEATSLLPIPILLLFLFPPVFAGFWSLVVYILGAASGWRRLAERFPADEGRRIGCGASGPPG